MKGISAIIAVVLILLITVALAASAYIFFSTTFSGVTQTAGTSISSTTEQFRILYSIESAKGIGTSLNFTIRNAGTVPITIDGLGVYVDEVPVSSVNPSTGTINPNEIRTFTSTSAKTITCGTSVVKVTFQRSASAQTAIISC